MDHAHRREEYATSSFDVRAIKQEKERLRALGYPLKVVAEFVYRFLRVEHFRHLRGQENVFLVAPSTSRTNLIPLIFAHKLAAEFGGSVVANWATPLSTTKAAKKGGIGKIRDPVRFAEDPEALATLKTLQGSRFILVDDVVTTGETTDALRELLGASGLRVSAILSLGQAEMRKVTARDIERLAVKLGEPSLHAEVAAVLGGRLKHRANYIERSLHENCRSEVRAYFRDEARRNPARAVAVQPGGERGGEQLDAGNPRLQPGPLPQAGHSRGHSHAAHPVDRCAGQRKGVGVGG